ncbi:acetolactate synthase small subunit [Streptomonospora nanhaiensis]|uniref:Acetolactate synthase small subunit n=1 Tax=Streptomonospora nanhaiensis TaxID=1323731 RepID=A0A853BM60_9ACTN|nr:acetolactate synthase small subunit [Streptomonospora nanhaiensis]MBV2365509.1 acetolactate synthase small subunit [Streptomonospora nanhaiensis]MBX9391440.1 acetolactate synthase small subunit [Streptomonospora nanhaiensis]NYI95757.1 acetolactate synthase-1/3 small subunit [Streptomonospora nanhaiensis]
MTQHTLSVLVEDTPGILARTSALFSRRGFNIHSLSVSTTEYEGLSRMTIVVNCDRHPLEQVTKQLNKLVNVIKIVEMDNDASVRRELLLAKVKADAGNRAAVIQTAELFRANIVDVGPDVVVVEATGRPEKLDALVRNLEPFGIKELVKSGLVALGRGPRSITDRSLRAVERSA